MLLKEMSEIHVKREIFSVRRIDWDWENAWRFLLNWNWSQEQRGEIFNFINRLALMFTSLQHNHDGYKSTHSSDHSLD
jgi:hypothetical protein